MPGKTIFIIEDTPLSPVLAAVAGIATRTVERGDFKIQLVQRPNISGKNEIANALKILSANSQALAPGETVSDDLTATIVRKKSYVAGFLVATGTSKAVLSNGS